MSDILTEEYTLQSEPCIEKWGLVRTNIHTYVREYSKKNDSLMAVLIHMKKCFHLTPITLKTLGRRDILRYRILALYILVNYSKASILEISTAFHVNVDMLTRMQDHERLEIYYADKLEIYFKEKENAYSINTYCNLAFIDVLMQNESFSKEILDTFESEIYKEDIL